MNKELILSGRDIKNVNQKGNNYSIKVKLTDMDIRWLRYENGIADSFELEKPHYEKELTLGIDKDRKFVFLLHIKNRMDLTDTGLRKLKAWFEKHFYKKGE